MTKGLVVVERMGEIVELPDESLIGRSTTATLRIKETFIHRFHAAVLSEGPSMELRALSACSVRTYVGSSPRDSHRHVIEIGQVWDFAENFRYVVVGLRVSDTSEGTAGTAVVWRYLDDGIVAECGGARALVKNKPSRLLAALLQTRGGWIDEQDLIATMWPSDLVFKGQDRKAYTNSLNVCLHQLRQVLKPCGLGTRVEYVDHLLRVHFEPRWDRVSEP